MSAIIVSAEATIAAPPDVVWDALIDMRSYTAWSTMLHYLSGRGAQSGEWISPSIVPAMSEVSAVSYQPSASFFRS